MPRLSVQKLHDELVTPCQGAEQDKFHLPIVHSSGKVADMKAYA